MENTTYNFTVNYEGEDIPVIIVEKEQEEQVFFYVELPGRTPFELFLSEDDEWVSNDENAPEEDLVLLIGDTFENLEA